MLGRGLESLIPKKNEGNPAVELSDSDKVYEVTDHQSAPAAGGDLDSLPADKQVASDGSSISREGQSHSGLETSPTTFPERRKAEEAPKFNKPNISSKLPLESVFQIEVDKIKPNPHQPRRHFDEEALKELALSIREFGVFQPLVVCKIESENENGTLVEYELIAGERRLLASKIAGLKTVPVIVRRPSIEREKLEIAIIENIQRADLNPLEVARAFAKLQDEFKLTQREIAAKLGKSREVIANSVRLLNLPSEIQEALANGRINESHARLLLAVESIINQRRLFEDILKDNLTVREVKSRVRRIKEPGPIVSVGNISRHSVDPELEALKDQLEEFLGTKIDLSQAGDVGKITINFYSAEELKAIADKLLKQNDNQSL